MNKGNGISYRFTTGSEVGLLGAVKHRATSLSWMSVEAASTLVDVGLSPAASGWWAVVLGDEDGRKTREDSLAWLSGMAGESSGPVLPLTRSKPSA